MDFLTENSIKPVLSKIADDVKGKASTSDVNNYLQEHMSEPQTVALETVLNGYYTKTEVNRIINNIDTGSGSGTITDKPNVLYDNSGFDKYSSMDMMHNMLVGYNLGNQFECWNKKPDQLSDDVIDKDTFYETLWGNPKISKGLIEYIASLGFNAVRLPVSWLNHIEPTNNMIELSWIRRVQEVVDMIIKNGMYCIINVHHDGCYRDKAKKFIFDENGTRFDESMAYFSNLWYQIGDYFKDYGYKLLFEGYNEVTNSVGNMSPNANKEAVAAQFAQRFIDIIRSQGGNNANRFLVIPNYGGVSLMTLSTFNTIKDTATDKLLLATHAYPTGDTLDTYPMMSRLNANIGILVDETGVMPADKNNYASNCRATADKKQIATFWWDNGQREFNLIDRIHLEPTNDALGNYLGRTIERKTYTYPIKDMLMPYYVKLYTETPMGTYTDKKYLVVCSQKPITSLTVVNNASKGYYAMSGNEGGLYTMYVSDDGLNYKILETAVCNRSATICIDFKHILYGTTESTICVDGNYTISNLPITEDPTPDPEPEPDPQPVTGSGISDYINSSKFNLNGLDKTQFDDVSSNGSLYDNRVLFFADDFDDGLDDTLYQYKERSVDPNNHKSIYDGENEVSVNNGVVTVNAEKKDTEFNGDIYPYATGMLEPNIEFQNCLFEAKMKNTKNKGWNVAFWTCGYSIRSVRSWAYCGEIDIFEDVVGNNGLAKSVALHFARDFGDYAGATSESKTILNNDVYKTFINSGNDNEWHIYGCELMQNKIRLYFDHVPFYEWDTSKLQYANGFNPFNYGNHFIFAIAQTGKVEDTAEEGTRIDIDWMRAWSLKGKTSSDLIPQSVQLVDLGTKETIETGNKIKVGNFAQLTPIYTPSSVPFMMNLDALVYQDEDKTSLIASNKAIMNNTSGYDSGLGVKLISEGKTTLTYKDLLGTTTSIELEGYNDTIPNGEINLEDFNNDTAKCKYGRYASISVDKTFSWNSEYTTTGDKSICFGLYKVEPNTTYNINHTFASDGMRTVILDSDYKVLVNKTYDKDSMVISTPDNACYILLQYYVAYSRIINELYHIHKYFKGNPWSFSKQIENPISCTDIAVDDTITATDNGKISYTLVPSNCTDSVSFTSNNGSILRINNTGQFTVVKTGTATVTITCGSISKTITMNVTKTEVEPEPQPQPTEQKTIYKADYSPNGEAFTIGGIDWNKDNDTLFCSLTCDDPTILKQSVFTVAPDVNNVSIWAPKQHANIHTVFPYDANNNVELDVLCGGQLKQSIPITGNQLKIAINKDNFVVNGVSTMLHDGIWYKELTSGQLSRWNGLMGLANIAVGSAEGSVRSYCTYHEISVHHKLYTSEELVALTSTSEENNNTPTPTYNHCTSITSDDTIEINPRVNDTMPLSYTLTPSNCTDVPSFTSSNKEVLTIDDTGLVTFLTTGSSVVTIICGEISKSTTFNVIINDTIYSLPSDYETAKYTNNDIYLKDKFPYYAILYDKVNNQYHLYLTSDCRTGTVKNVDGESVTTYHPLQIRYNTSKSVVIFGATTGQIGWIKIESNTPCFSNLTDYLDHTSDGRIKKCALSSGSISFAANEEEGLLAVTNVDDIEIICSNYDIEVVK